MIRSGYKGPKYFGAAEAAAAATARLAVSAAELASLNAAFTVALLAGKPAAYDRGFDTTFDTEMLAHCHFVHDLFGNPFRPVAVKTKWLRWNNAILVNMSQEIYDERRFADLPILAETLESAGCNNADILSHCRQPGEHVRGCWVIDLLLGKE
jgi:hypothetical protein